MSEDTQRRTKAEQLREWRELFSIRGPAVTVESDGAVSIGPKSPVVKDFPSGSESFRQMIGAG